MFDLGRDENRLAVTDHSQHGDPIEQFAADIAGTRQSRRSGFLDQLADPQWAQRVQDHLEQGRIGELIEESTASRLARAGNIGGELLNWIAMLSVVGDRKPIFIAPEIEHGHAYAAWRLD